MFRYHFEGTAGLQLYRNSGQRLLLLVGGCCSYNRGDEQQRGGLDGDGCRAGGRGKVGQGLGGHQRVGKVWS